jgi:YebC/PmpR family DNA-binding regulatory protein
MSGHSKWSTIKHKKAATDARRGKMFNRILREITVAARLGGSDPRSNSRLRGAIQDARSSSVPNDNIDRAIKKGTGELEGEAYEEVTYEGYGPGGVALLVEGLTDNRNRTAGEVRNLFVRHGGSLGENGCVSWMFQRRGYFAFDRDAMSEEAFMELALELGVDDISVEEEQYEIITPMEDYARVREALEAREAAEAGRGPAATAKQLVMIPQTTMQLPADRVKQVLRLLEALEDQDDVQNVWANFDPDEVGEMAARS